MHVRLYGTGVGLERKKNGSRRFILLLVRLSRITERSEKSKRVERRSAVAAENGEKYFR